MKMSKFAEAIGVWELNIGGQELSLKPEMNDVRKFRKILLNEKHRKDKDLLFDKFATFMKDMIKKHYPEEKPEDIDMFVEININPLFEEAMVAFRWTTREEMEKQKQMGLQELKKEISSV